MTLSAQQGTLRSIDVFSLYTICPAYWHAQASLLMPLLQETIYIAQMSLECCLPCCSYLYQKPLCIAIADCICRCTQQMRVQLAASELSQVDIASMHVGSEGEWQTMHACLAWSCPYKE